MKNLNVISKLLTVSLLLVFGASCTGSLEKLPEKVIVVGFGLQDNQTRTSIDADHGRFYWKSGDKVAVWAKNSEGSFTLSNQTFNLLSTRLDASGAYFTSTLDQAMPESSYTYYIAYPLPVSVNGTSATFDLPSVQDGKAGDGVDIVIAEPVDYGPLEAFDESNPVDINNGMKVSMKHLLHFLRFYIPNGWNRLGEPVERIEFSMPQAIAGTVTADVTDASASLSAGSRTVTMILDSPIGESVNARYDYATAGIYPPATTYGEGDEMEVTLYSATRIGHVDPIRLAGRDFAAGHITSVPLKPTSVSDFYSVTFALASNNLGEEVQSVTLTLPEGTSWPGTSSNIYVHSESDGFSIGESFRISTSSRDEFRALSGKDVTVAYESENAIVYETLSLGDLSAVSRIEKALNCPYLLFQDFSGVESFSSSDGHSASNTGSKSAVEFLDGWSIARAGAEAGKSVRMAAHREWFATYDSRCDSPMLSGIKNGKSVEVELSFNYSMGRQEGGVGSAPKLGATLYIGSCTTSGGISSGSTDGNFGESFNVNEESGSYDNVGHEHVTTISGMTNGTRISWREVPDGTSGTSNGTYWLYLDNVRVSIRK